MSQAAVLAKELKDAEETIAQQAAKIAALEAEVARLKGE